MIKDKPIHPPVGFHGDTYLLKLVEFLFTKVSVFIETGTNIGATLQYVSRTYPKVKCLSCEPRKSSFDRAVGYLKDYGAKIFNETSQEFLNRLDKDYAHLKKDPALFWLDAHGGNFTWPIREEFKYITKNFKRGLILVDDFLVPGKKQFQHDKYGKQHCSFEFVKNSINKNCKYTLYYPAYTEKTSKYHPLVGWGLFEFGLNYSIDRVLPKIAKKAK